MIYGHKTAGEIVMATGSESIRRLEREYFRVDDVPEEKYRLLYEGMYELCSQQG